MPLSWFLVPVVIVAAYVVFGLTGFGGAIILIPILSFILPVKTVVPLVATLGFLAALTMGIRERRLSATRELWRILPGIALGVAAGVYLLSRLPSQWILPALGVLVLAFGISGFVRPGGMRLRVSSAFALPVGVLAGVVGGVFGTEGPIYVIYLSRRVEGVTEFRATLATLFTLATGARVLGYTISGLMLHGRLLLIGTALYPFVLVGLFVGNRLHHALPAQQVRHGINLLLIASGISILLKAL